MKVNLEDYNMENKKFYKKKLDITDNSFGKERRKEMVEEIADKGTYLPKSVLIEDMDQGVIDFIKSDKGLGITIDGEKVPAMLLTNQKWSEFNTNWANSDEYRDLKIPFITIIRNGDIQQGENQAGYWNIPGGDTYTYMKVPTFDGIRKGVDLYKIPQPTSVNLTYEVRLFANKFKDVNKFNVKVQKVFQSKQAYVSINGHPMPLHLEAVVDETNNDFEDRRFYVNMIEMKLLGYVLDEEDFIVTSTIDRTSVDFSENSIKKTIYKINDDSIIYNYKFSKFRKYLDFISDLNFEINENSISSELGGWTFNINDEEIILGTANHLIKMGDVISISNPNIGNNNIKFNLKGKLIMI